MCVYVICKVNSCMLTAYFSEVNLDSCTACRHSNILKKIFNWGTSVATDKTMCKAFSLPSRIKLFFVALFKDMV